jgi:hypothetical protein
VIGHPGAPLATPFGGRWLDPVTALWLAPSALPSHEPLSVPPIAALRGMTLAFQGFAARSAEWSPPVVRVIG